MWIVYRAHYLCSSLLQFPGCLEVNSLCGVVDHCVVTHQVEVVLQYLGELLTIELLTSLKIAFAIKAETRALMGVGVYSYTLVLPDKFRLKST